MAAISAKWRAAFQLNDRCEFEIDGSFLALNMKFLQDPFGGTRKFAAVHHSLGGRGQQDSPLLTVQPTGTDNTTRFVDVAGFGQDPARSAGDQPVQIAHDPAVTRTARAEASGPSEKPTISPRSLIAWAALCWPPAGCRVARATSEQEGVMLSVTGVAVTDHFVPVVQIPGGRQLPAERLIGTSLPRVNRNDRCSA